MVNFGTGMVQLHAVLRRVAVLIRFDGDGLRFWRAGPIGAVVVAGALVAAAVVLIFDVDVVVDVVTALEANGNQVCSYLRLLAFGDADAEPLFVAVLVGSLRGRQGALVEAFAEVEPVGGVVC